nr:hypothetical protein [uncultured Carboxylicivirga sp.]
MKTFGERLEFVIKNSSFKSGKAFCDKAEISTTTLSRLIKGHTKPSYEFLVTLLILVPDIDSSWLLTGRSNQESLETRVKAAERESMEAIRELNEIKTVLKKRYSNRINPQGTLPGFECETQSISA